MSWLDRGNKLWVGHRIILPEHEELIHELERKQKVFQPPELDEDQLQEMEYIMQRALYEDMAVVVTYATTYGPEEFCGFVTKVNHMKSGWRSPTGTTGKSFVLRIC